MADISTIQGRYREAMDFFFHPVESKYKTAALIITYIACILLSALWIPIYFGIKRWDNQRLLVLSQELQGDMAKNADAINALRDRRLFLKFPLTYKTSSSIDSLPVSTSCQASSSTDPPPGQTPSKPQSPPTSHRLTKLGEHLTPLQKFELASKRSDVARMKKYLDQIQDKEVIKTAFIRNANAASYIEILYLLYPKVQDDLDTICIAFTHACKSSCLEAVQFFLVNADIPPPVLTMCRDIVKSLTPPSIT